MPAPGFWVGLGSIGLVSHVPGPWAPIGPGPGHLTQTLPAHWSRETAFVVVGAGILLTLAAGVGDLVSVLSALEAHSADCPGQTNSFPLSSPLLSTQPSPHNTPHCNGHSLFSHKMIQDERRCCSHYCVSGRAVNRDTEQLFIHLIISFLLLIHQFIIAAEGANKVHCLTGILKEAETVITPGSRPPHSRLT